LHQMDTVFAKRRKPEYDRLRTTMAKEMVFGKVKQDMVV